MATNFRVKTQAAAYKEGAMDAYDLLVTVLEERGDINFLIDVLEDNARPDTRERLRAFYAAKNGVTS